MKLNLVVFIAIIAGYAVSICCGGGEYTDGEINTQVYISNIAIGGGGGTRFALENHSAQLRSLTVYRNVEEVRALVIELNNGESMTAGTPWDNDQPAKLEFSNDERIGHIIIYYYKSSNYPTETVKGLSIKTNKGTKEAYVYGVGPETAYLYFKIGTLSAGSGLCAGVFGAAGGSLDRIGLAMLRNPPPMSKRCFTDGLKLGRSSRPGDEYPHGSIDTNVYISNFAIGGYGGNPFVLENQNALLQSLTVYRNKMDVRGVEIKLNNGESIKAGTLYDNDQPVKLEFSDDEHITRIIIYYDESPNYPSKTVKGLSISTDKGVKEAYIYGGCSNSGFQSHELPVGSGYCAGVFGAGMGSLDRIGLAMLRMPPPPKSNSKSDGGCSHRVVQTDPVM